MERKKNIIVALYFLAFIVTQAEPSEDQAVDNSCFKEKRCPVRKVKDHKDYWSNRWIMKKVWKDWKCDSDNNVYKNECHFECAEAKGESKKCPETEETKEICFRMADIIEFSRDMDGVEKHPACTASGLRYPTHWHARCDIMEHPLPLYNDDGNEIKYDEDDENIAADYNLFRDKMVECKYLKSVENWSPSADGNAVRPASCLIAVAAIFGLLVQQI